MKGAIPRSFVNSVNGIFPDATGNIELAFPVISVNGETGATIVKNLYTPTANAVMFLQEESDSYVHFISRGPNYGQTASTAQLFIDKNGGYLNWSWKNKIEGSQDVYSQIYDSNHQPPYPVTSVQGQTGAVAFRSIPTTVWSMGDTDGGTGYKQINYADGVITAFCGTGWSTPASGGQVLAGAPLYAPSVGWWHHLILTHPNPAGYFFDLICGISENTLFYHRVDYGKSAGMYRIWDTAHFTCYTNSGTLYITYTG